MLDQPLAQIGGKGLFVKELEQALLEGRADLAVHSLKDMPAVLPEGLVIAAVCERADPRDVLITAEGWAWQALPLGARIGTSSLRRAVQLRAVRPDIVIVPLRGNVPTRLEKWQGLGLDGLILAQAGLERLQMLESLKYVLFDPQVVLPAVGQGAIALECRQTDEALRKMLQSLHHDPTGLCVAAERRVNASLNGSCQVPLAALAIPHAEGIHLTARVGCLDGHSYIEAAGSSAAAVIEQLEAQGAGELIESIRKQGSFNTGQ